MSKNKKKSRSSQSSRKDTAPGATPSEESQHRQRNIRETIESVAIAFILAFLFRTFEAEAFVIPTGSMAPTLQGRHKDVDCPQCGHRTRVSASSEVDDLQISVQGREIVTATCPICRYTMTVDPDPFDLDFWPEEEIAEGASQVAYNGDRILVTKFTYEFGNPQRWDVVVFKYPGDSKLNYIKRLVGLPNEDVKIFQGDIFVRKQGTEDPFQIARKGADKARAMQQLVHDNHYIPSNLIQGGWPTRWIAWPASEESSGGSWEMQLDTEEKIARQTFTIDGTSQNDQWIRYRHVVPSFETWRDIQQGPLPENYPKRPQLITDFYAYNTWQTRQERGPDAQPPTVSKEGLHWVGDLMVECDLEVLSEQGELLVDLVEGGIHFTCRIDVKSGKATLASSGEITLSATGQTALQGSGEYRIAMANVDDQIYLWVDGSLVQFEEGAAQYERTGSVIPTSTPEDPGDLAPVGIGSQGVELKVNHLKVNRDIYYIADHYDHMRLGTITDYDGRWPPILHFSRQALADFLSDPSKWEAFAHRNEEIFPLEEDQFFVLGDNSPFSKDGRLWDEGRGIGHHVDRKLLVGKALFIYWPHSWERIPGTSIPFPFFPNFSDMGFVR